MITVTDRVTGQTWTLEPENFPEVYAAFPGAPVDVIDALERLAELVRIDPFPAELNDLENYLSLSIGRTS